jgi:hypothetical protein
LSNCQGRLLIEGQIRPIEHAKTRDLEPDVRTAEIAGRVRFTEKDSGGMTIATRDNAEEILAAPDLPVGRMGATERDAERDTQRAAIAAHDIPPGSLTICHAASTNKPKPY